MMAVVSKRGCSKEKYVGITVLVLITLLVIQYGINMVFYSNYDVTSLVKMDWIFEPVSKDTDTLYMRKLFANNSYREFQKSLNVSVIIINGTMFVSAANSSTFENSSTVGNSSVISSCPLISSNLVGHLGVKTDILSWMQLNNSLPNVKPGGRWQPSDCRSRHRVAIIIPYRDRAEHLKIFLRQIHPFLQRQQLDYGIYVIEQALPTRFNRAMLMNIGYAEAIKIYNYQCFVFHDVDLIPEDDRNIYSCPASPRHMSGFIDKFNYHLPYNDIFGGVSAMTKEQFVKVNGFSNMFFGWGGEDDDMHNRVIEKGGYKIIRYAPDISHYMMLSHAKNVPSPERYKYLYGGKERWSTDGINSLKYKVVSQKFHKLYTWMMVQIDEKEIRNVS